MADDVGLGQLADRLRALRGNTGLTLRELSREVHASDSSLSRYFAGQALPPWEVVEALANLAGADPVELRQCWESVAQARKRARWPEHSDLAGERQPVPLWEPEPGREAPPAATGTGRRVGLLVAVAVLTAAAAASGWAMRGEDHIAVSVPPTPPGPGAGNLPTPTAPSTSPSVSTPTDRPAALPPTTTPTGTVSPTSPAPAASRPTKPAPSSASPTSPTVLRSGMVVALTSTDSGTDSVPYVIDVANWSMDDGAPVHLWYRRTDGDYRNQLWTAEQVNSKHWRLVNVNSGKCLYRGAGGTVFQTACTAGDTTQEWIFGRDGTLHSALDGACMEIKGHQRLTDAGLQTATCDGGWYQLRHAEQRPLG
jgi:transcriptional regulator with XRE-family HTH domain